MEQTDIPASALHCVQTYLTLFTIDVIYKDNLKDNYIMYNSNVHFML